MNQQRLLAAVLARFVKIAMSAQLAATVYGILAKFATALQALQAVSCQTLVIMNAMAAEL